MLFIGYYLLIIIKLHKQYNNYKGLKNKKNLDLQKKYMDL